MSAVERVVRSRGRGLGIDTTIQFGGFLVEALTPLLDLHEAVQLG